MVDMDAWRFVAAPRRARIRRSRNAPTTPSSMSRTRTRRLTRDGPVWRCRPRREWEVAARGGLASAAYTWGDEPEQAGQRLANYWHGDFPWRPRTGYGRTAPVGSFPANGYGLFDMAGNVWEWTSDWYADTREGDPCCEADSYDPRSRSSGFRARSSRAARSCAPTTTACATGPPRAGRR